MAVAFDIENLTTRGEPVVVIDDLQQALVRWILD